jgi:threonine dehydrogenase-like Zn-dependent dehydrogenase
VNLCTGLKALGVDIDGGFAEYCIVPKEQLFHLPPSMTWEEAALIEPVACALNGVKRAGIEIGDDVLILGGGPMGLIMLQLAKLQGAGRVILCEKMASRQKLGAEVGADIVTDTLEDFKNHPEKAPDVVIECIGNPATQQAALEIVKPGGQVVLFGDGDMTQKFSIPSQLFYQKELTARGAALNPFTHDQAFRIVASGRMKLKPLVSRSITVDELPELLNGGYQKDDVKIMVSFG